MSKDKQISEIARDFNKGMCSDREVVESCTRCVGASEHCLLYEIATEIYNAGYRKQGEGEWVAKPQEWYIDATDWMCSNCKTEFSSFDMVGDDFSRMMKYCPECGARMKGGAE